MPDGALHTLRELLTVLAEGVATLAELAATLIITVAILQALARAARVFTQRSRNTDGEKQHLQLALGRWLALSLEFLLAADILLTAVAPTWEDIGKLGAIALIRTALNYFLQKEMEAHARQHGPPHHRVDAST